MLTYFQDQAELKHHRFEVGMKLEALNPTGHNMVSPATVRKVINNKYFIIEMDDLRPKEERKVVRLCCSTEYLGIYPVSWCQCKGIRLVPPPGRLFLQLVIQTETLRVFLLCPGTSVKA